MGNDIFELFLFLFLCTSVIFLLVVLPQFIERKIQEKRSDRTKKQKEERLNRINPKGRGRFIRIKNEEKEKERLNTIKKERTELNIKQKIFVMIGLGSLVVFLSTLTSDRFDLDDPFYFGKSTNYIGLISIFNVVVSLVGFKLFKD